MKMNPRVDNLVFRFVVLAAIFFLLWLWWPRAHAADLTITITQPDLSTCADGSPSATNCPLTGVEIQQKDDSGTWVRKEVWGPTATTQKYTGYGLGKTYCFRARNQSGTVYSSFTDESCAAVPFISPRAPQGVTTKQEIKLSVETKTTVTAQ